MDQKPPEKPTPPVGQPGAQPNPRRPLPRTAEEAPVSTRGTAQTRKSGPQQKVAEKSVPKSKPAQTSKTGSTAAVPGAKFPRKGSGRAGRMDDQPEFGKKGMGLAIKFLFPITALVAIALFAFGVIIQRSFAEVMQNDVKKAGIQAVNILARMGETLLAQQDLHPGAWVLTTGVYTKASLAQKLPATDLEKKILSLGYGGASEVQEHLRQFVATAFVNQKHSLKTAEDLAKLLGFEKIEDARTAIQGINAGTPVIQELLRNLNRDLPPDQPPQTLPYIGFAEAPLEVFNHERLVTTIRNVTSGSGVLSSILPVAVKGVDMLLPTDILDASITREPNRDLVAGARSATGRLVIDVFNATEADSRVNYDGTARQITGIEIRPAIMRRDGDSEECMLFTRKFRVLSPRTGELRGEAYLALSSHRIKAEQNRMRLMIFLVGGLAVLGVVALCFVITGIVIRPVKILMRDMVTVSGGDLTHTTEAHSSDEIGALASQFNLMTQKLLVAREAERESERLESELEMAREIQMKLLPTDIPRIPSFDIHAVYHPAKEVGGDYYDFVPIDKEHLGVIVADVSGKGIPGSMVMATTRTILRFVASRNKSSGDTLARTNHIVAQDIRRGMFVTALYLVLNARTRQMCVSSAGHNPMALFREATGEVELVNPNGIALGFDKGPIFERTIKQDVLQLNPGDRVVMYTDGVVEAMNADNEEYTDERFYAFVKTNARLTSKEFVERLLADLNRHKGEAEQHDDITVVTFRIV